MTGKVTSNKMTKAIVVAVSSLQMHSKYRKQFKIIKKFHAACEDSSKFQIGDTVEIVETRPISKTIKWKVVK